jgi:hypothetical protein
VGNLPYETGEAELEEMFGKIGPVDSVRVMRDMATGRARGFAFVEMASDDDAQRAVDELNQAQLGGRTVSVWLSVMLNGTPAICDAPKFANASSSSVAAPAVCDHGIPIATVVTPAVVTRKRRRFTAGQPTTLVETN